MMCPRHGGALITPRPYDQQGYGILYLYLFGLGVCSNVIVHRYGYRFGVDPYRRRASLKPQSRRGKNYKDGLSP